MRNRIDHLVAVPAPSRAGNQARLASYVREHARRQLWPEDARRVEALLATGDTSAAIWLYFDASGTRRSLSGGAVPFYI